jgi:hypothetical protein
MSSTTQPATPATKQTFLQKLGADFKKVFSWLGNPNVQKVIVAGEAVGEAVAADVSPALAGISPILNSWTQEIFKAESLAAAAGAQNGTGAQKAAMVLSSVTPQVLQFAAANGLAAPTGAELQSANSLLVQFLNTLTAPAA